MEIGKRIKEMRQKRGITQEAMAQHFGLTPQAISKWERGVATPDIALLPDISAFFGVTIDELFALSDDTRMERIQNMLLEAVNLGYGACWCGIYPNEERTQQIKDLLGIESVPVALVTVGVPDEEPNRRGYYDAAIVHYVR